MNLAIQEVTIILDFWYMSTYFLVLLESRLILLSAKSLFFCKWSQEGMDLIVELLIIKIEVMLNVYMSDEFIKFNRNFLSNMHQRFVVVLTDIRLIINFWFERNWKTWKSKNSVWSFCWKRVEIIVYWGFWKHNSPFREDYSFLKEEAQVSISKNSITVWKWNIIFGKTAFSKWKLITLLIRKWLPHKMNQKQKYLKNKSIKFVN